MNVLFVISDISSSGGTARATTEIASGLADIGHDVSIVTLFGPTSPWFDLHRSVRVKGAGLAEAKGSFRRAAAISRYLRREACASGVEILVLVDTIFFAFCMPWVWRVHARVICWEHFNLSTSHGSPIRVIARLAASRLSARIVVLTERDANAWRRKYNISHRVQAIWNPVPRFLGSCEVAPPDADGRLVVLAVGHLTAVKGFDLLLRAWKRLSLDRAGWVLRIVGGGSEEKALKLLVKELSICDSVEFAGEVRDMASQYRSASVYVMSSRREGLPMTLLEAQHFGLPSVATDCVTGPREILGGGSGLLVPIEVGALADGLRRLITDSKLRLKLKEKALANAELYRSENICREWDLLFKDL